MSWVAVGVTAVGVAGAYMQSEANKSAADSQNQAAQNSNQLQWNMYQQQRQDQAPWRQAGVSALNQIQDNSFMDNWQSQDPGYDFRMQEGQKALQASQAAKGLSNSGRAMKELTRYGQDYASNEYNNAYNRNYGRLSSLAGIGQTSTNLTGQAGQTAANQIGQNTIGAANAQGAAGVASANAYGNALSNGANTWAQYQMMNNMRSNNTTGSGSLT